MHGRVEMLSPQFPGGAFKGEDTFVAAVEVPEEPTGHAFVAVLGSSVKGFEALIGGYYEDRVEGKHIYLGHAWEGGSLNRILTILSNISSQYNLIIFKSQPAATGHPRFA